MKLLLVNHSITLECATNIFPNNDQLCITMDRSISFILCCGSLILLIVHQSFSFSDFGEKNRVAKVLLVQHEMAQFNDSNERENASIHWIVDSWAQADAAKKSAERAKESAERAKESVRNLTTELDNLKIEKGKILSDKKNLEVELVARETGIGFRSAIEEVERRIHPDWMFGTKLTREQRFILSLSLGITKYGRFLRDKILKCPEISIFDVSKNADEYYNKLSLKVGHFQEVKIPTNDAEWNATYKFLGARHMDQQQSLKLILEPLEIASDVTKKTAGTFEYFLLLTKVDFKAVESDIQTGIQTAIPSALSVNIKIVKNYKGIRTDYVALSFETTSYLQSETIHEQLMKYKKKPFQVPGFAVNVYCEWEKSEAFALLQSTSQSSVPAG